MLDVQGTSNQPPLFRTSKSDEGNVTGCNLPPRSCALSWWTMKVGNISMSWVIAKYEKSSLLFLQYQRGEGRGAISLKLVHDACLQLSIEASYSSIYLLRR